MIAGVLLAIMSVRSLRGNEVSRRMDDFVVGYERARVDRIRVPIQQGFSDSLLNRTVVATVKRTIQYFGQITPKRSIENLNRQLAIARNPFNLRAREFYGVRLIFLLVGIGLAFLLNYKNANQIASLFRPATGGFLTSVIMDYKSPTLLALYGGLLIVILFFLLPVVWLRGQVKKVQQEIRKGLPDALDMLSVCVDAGLGFDQALQKVSDYWKTAIGTEFRRVVSEMEVGVSRANALRNMSSRLGVIELSSFVAVIIQSDSLGMRIADVVHGQADQMRIIRQFQAKEIAYRLPAKMIVPLALLIFPALMAVILGPIVPSLLDLFLNF